MDMDILTFEWMQGRAARVPTSHVWANLPTLSLAGVGETNETRETQNIRLVFWGLQRKHEEYCEVGVGLVYPLPFFRSQRKGRDNRKDSVRVAHTCRFVACVRPPVLEGRRAWNPSSHTSQKTAMYAPPLIFGSSRGGAYMPFCGMCAIAGLECSRASAASRLRFQPPALSYRQHLPAGARFRLGPLSKPLRED